MKWLFHVEGIAAEAEFGAAPEARELLEVASTREEAQRRLQAWLDREPALAGCRVVEVGPLMQPPHPEEQAAFREGDARYESERYDRFHEGE